MLSAPKVDLIISMKLTKDTQTEKEDVGARTDCERADRRRLYALNPKASGAIFRISEVPL